MLFSSIVLALGVMLIASTCFHLLAGGTLFTNSPSFKISWFNRTDSTTWMMSGLLGAGVGVINYFTPKIANLLWLAPIFFVAMIAVMIGIIAWGRIRACEVKEFFWLTLLLLVVFFTTKSTAAMTVALVQNAFWGSLIMLLPSLLLVGGIGVFTVFWFLYRHYTMGAGRNHLIIGRVLMGIFTIILAIMLVSGGAWSNFPKLSFGNDDLTEAEQAELDAQANEIAKVMSLSDSEFEVILEKSGLKDATLNRNSLPSSKRDRLFEDGISIPLSTNKSEKVMKDELMDELRNPIWLAARFDRLSEITYKDGTTVADKYPAIKKYVELFNEHGVEYFVEKQNEDGEFPLTKEYLRYAVIGELLFDCTTTEIQKDVTTKYVWRLDETGVYSADGTFDLSKLKTVKKEYVEDEDYNDVIVITHLTKEKGKVLYVEYFDIYDRAPVILDTDKPDNPDNPGGKDPNPNPDPSPDPKPNPDPKPDPDPQPDPDPGYNKDKTKGTQGDLVAPNDNKGPGEDTNNGKGATTSTKDQPTNSNHMTYDEYKEAIDEIKEANEAQKEQQKPKTEDKNTNVDDNSAKGTGNGGIDTPTPVKDEAKTSDGNAITNDENNPAGSWGGPAD